MSTEDRINALYGAPALKPAETESFEPQNSEALDDLYPPKDTDTEANPYSLEKDSVEAQLYGATNKMTLSGETEESLGVIAGSEEEHELLIQRVGWMANESGASQQDVETLTAIAEDYAYGAQQHDPGETMRQLTAEFGSGNLRAKLDDAAILLHSFPEFSDWLNSTGAGNDPRMIRHVLRIAETPRAQARIKTLKERGGW